MKARLRFLVSGDYPNSPMPQNMVDGICDEIMKHMGAYGFKNVQVASFAENNLNDNIPST